MSELGIQLLIAVLLLTQCIPFFTSLSIIKSFPYSSQEEEEYVRKWALPISIAVNVLVLLVTILIIFPTRNPLLQAIELLTLKCSYSDIMRLVSTNLICLALSMIFPLVAGCVYFGSSDALRLDKRSKAGLMLLCSVLCVPMLFACVFAHSGTSTLELEEICRKTTITVQDLLTDEEEEQDISYVVLHNSGTLAQELGTLYLSDDPYALSYVAIDPVRVAPGESYQFTMSADRSMNIKKVGGSIVYLSDKSGNILDSVTVPALTKGDSYKRSGEAWKIVHPVVETAISVAAPTFSAESGFYDTAFSLTLSGAPGTTVHYTLDCTTPTADSPVYNSPIWVYDRSGEENQYVSLPNLVRDYLNKAAPKTTPVDKCFVVRAVAVDAQGQVSSVVTKSYFVSLDKYRNRTVLSLVSDPDGLFSDETGICVTGTAYDEWYQKAYANTPPQEEIDIAGRPTENYIQHGMDWERQADMEVFDQAESILTQPAGIRVQGNGSRYDLLTKRFSIYARKAYSGSSYFNKNLLNEAEQHSLYTRAGDLFAISQTLGQDCSAATIDCRPITVFVDGEYWQRCYLCEKFDEKNFAQKYGLHPDNVVIVKNGESADSMNEGIHPFSLLWSFLKTHDLAEDDAYEQYGEILDIQSYIDASCYEVFLANTDYNETFNNLYWHTVVRENEEEGDTRWRCGLYDMDLLWSLSEEFQGTASYQINPFQQHGKFCQTSPITEWPIFSNLRKNEQFNQQFVLTFMDLVNTRFSVEYTTKVLNDLSITDNSRWEFFQNRLDYIVPYLAEEFDLSGTQETVTLVSNLPGAPIRLNTIQPELAGYWLATVPEVPEVEMGWENTEETPFVFSGEYRWSGSYFTDYPVTVSTDQPGFSHWEVTANGVTKTYTGTTLEVPVAKGGVQIRAVFQ